MRNITNFYTIVQNENEYIVFNQYLVEVYYAGFIKDLVNKYDQYILYDKQNLYIKNCFNSTIDEILNKNNIKHDYTTKTITRILDKHFQDQLL